MVSILTPIAIFTILLGICSSSSLSSYKNVYEGSKSESDLRRHVFRNYDKLVRPVKKPGNKITLAVSVTPLHMRELDEKNQVITLDAWMIMKWNDDYLTWEPSRFGNQTVLRVPSTEVWRPDVANYLAPSDTEMFPVPRTNVLIYNSGTVMWVPLYQIKGRCPVTRTKKIVTCNLKFGSWTYSELELDLQLYSEKADLSEFSDNNLNWKLMDLKTDRVSKYYPCCKEPYPYVEYNITLKRRHDNSFETNEVLQEDTPIKLQNIDLSDFADFEKLLRR